MTLRRPRPRLELLSRESLVRRRAGLVDGGNQSSQPVMT